MLTDQQIDGPVDKIISLGNLQAKFEAFGWEVILSEGNNMAAVCRCFTDRKTKNRKRKTDMSFNENRNGIWC